MKFRTAVVCALAFAIGACAAEEAAEAPVADAAPAMSADETAVMELAEYWATHFNMGHPGMVAGKYTEDSWFLGANGQVSEGPTEIEAFLGAMAEMNPQIAIEPADVMIFGDQGVAMGAYEMTLSPEGGEPMSYGGTYMTHHVKVDGAWAIRGHIGNLTEDPFEGFEYSPPAEMPADENGTMTDVTSAWTTHFNLGHASMVADFYTEDGMVSFSRGGPMSGREAVTAALQGIMDAAPTDIEIHDLATFELGEGWALDGGWWASNNKESGDRMQTGGYLNLMKQAEDGSWQVHWQVSNAWPADGM